MSVCQDGGIVDPLARNTLTKAAIETLGERVRTLAARHIDGSLALVQEGGYQPSHLVFATLVAQRGGRRRYRR